MPFEQTKSPQSRIPLLRIPAPDNVGSDSYRLQDGHVEFNPAGSAQWRRLTESDVRLHFTLDTPVGRWLGSLTSIAAVARELAG
jgi:hypothetical protein